MKTGVTLIKCARSERTLFTTALVQQARGEPKFIVYLRLAGVFCARERGLGEEIFAAFAPNLYRSSIQLQCNLFFNFFFIIIITYTTNSTITYTTNTSYNTNITYNTYITYNAYVTTNITNKTIVTYTTITSTTNITDTLPTQLIIQIVLCILL